MTARSVLTPFIGVRHHQECTARFDDVLGRLLADLGAPAPLDAWSMFRAPGGFEQAVAARLGPSGLMLFDAVELGGWVDVPVRRGRIMRLNIGNPALAVSMLRLAPYSGLLVPISLLLAGDDERNSCSLTYMVPSSLIVLEDNPTLIGVVKDLDARVGGLVRMALGDGPPVVSGGVAPGA